MHLRKLIVGLCLIGIGFPALANDRLVRLEAPAPLVESGLIKYMVPRFSLKTQVRVEIVADGAAADMRFGETGTPLFAGQDATWHMQIVSPDHPGTQRFADWLQSDIGLRTITGFAPAGTALYTLATAEEAAPVALTYDGDAVLGHKASIVMCGRCHVVDPANRMNDIGSTPSFFVLRSLPNWDERFETFYVLAPHGAFTQVADVTPPFPEDRPPPIVPVEMTLDDLEAILAYVASLEAADLGAPLQHQ
ncbi:hypothetical protein [Shimia sp. SDUM112013]|uniref:hypothetical protein n=1 Tax=Shimia sp. SDUM112013 TaxID=3136160 RepID=UPI0032ECF5FF